VQDSDNLPADHQFCQLQEGELSYRLQIDHDLPDISIRDCSQRQLGVLPAGQLRTSPTLTWYLLDQFEQGDTEMSVQFASLAVQPSTAASSPAPHPALAYATARRAMEARAIARPHRSDDPDCYGTIVVAGDETTGVSRARSTAKPWKHSGNSHRTGRRHRCCS